MVCISANTELFGAKSIRKSSRRDGLVWLSRSNGNVLGMFEAACFYDVSNMLGDKHIYIVAVCGSAAKIPSDPKELDTSLHTSALSIL